MVDTSESEIETDVLKYFKKHGWRKKKQSGKGERGKTDDYLTTTGGRIIFIEFKKSGKSPTPLQQLEIDQLVKEGFLVMVIDNIEDGEFLCDYLNQQFDWAKYHLDQTLVASRFKTNFFKYVKTRDVFSW